MIRDQNDIGKRESKRRKNKKVDFNFSAPHAGSACIAGNFNDFCAFYHKLLHKKYKSGCKESFLDDRGTRRELGRASLWAFFVAKPKPLLEVKMAITRQGDRRKGVRRQSGRRKGDIKKIKIGGERDKKQEVTVRLEAIPQKKASSVWMSQHEEFTAAWCQTFITKKRKRNPER